MIGWDLLYLAGLVLGSPYFVWRGVRRKRPPHHTAEKLALSGLPDPCDVLVHCVSVGETEAAVPIVAGLRDEGLEVLVTTGTATGGEVARKRFGDGVRFLPYDFTLPVGRFLRAARPRAVVLMELEVWPNLIRKAKALGASVLVVNGRMTEGSLKGYRFLRPLLTGTWRRIDWCGVQDDEQRARFELAGMPPDRIEVAGSVKFDREPPPGWENARADLGFAPEDLVLFAGSTHPGEEELVLQAWARARERFGGLKLVLAPRHLERLREVERLARDTGAAVKKRSEPGRADIVVLDTMGELAVLYGAADVVIMGGTLVEGVGGHNPIEPAVLGKPVIMGPHFDNFKDVVARLAEGGGLFAARDAGEALRTAEVLLSDPEKRKEAGGNAALTVRRHGGAARRYVRNILSRLAERRT